jgi:hypothetical protein
MVSIEYNRRSKRNEMVKNVTAESKVMINSDINRGSLRTETTRVYRGVLPVRRPLFPKVG